MNDSFYGQGNRNTGKQTGSDSPTAQLTSQQQVNHSATHGLLVNKDVASRRTAMFIDSAQRARQDVTRGRKIFLLGCLVVGLLIMTGPYLASTLAAYFFYGETQTVWALRRVANELWIVFAAPGLLLVICAFMGLAKRVPIAVFDLASQTVLLNDRRFQALPGWSARFDSEVIKLGDVQQLQLVSYKAKQLQYKQQPLDQCELNLVLSDGSRRLLAKQPGYASLFDDATRLCEFLDVPISDHCGQPGRFPA